MDSLEKKSIVILKKLDRMEHALHFHAWMAIALFVVEAVHLFAYVLLH